jgi:hypothetical protein
MANFTFLDIGDGDLLDIGDGDLLLIFLDVSGVMIYNVPAEDRVYVVPGDKERIYNVPAEDRIYEVPL